MYGEDGENYEYEWPDDENGDEGWGNDDNQDNDDPKIPVENAYYEAEGDMKSNPKKALDKFVECIQLEEALGDEVVYRFKAT